MTKNGTAAFNLANKTLTTFYEKMAIHDNATNEFDANYTFYPYIEAWFSNGIDYYRDF